MAVACQTSCSLLTTPHQATGLPCVRSNPADQKLLYTPQAQGKTSELHSAPSAGLFALPLGAFPLASGSLPISKWGPSYQLVGAIPRHHAWTLTDHLSLTELGSGTGSVICMSIAQVHIKRASTAGANQAHDQHIC